MSASAIKAGEAFIEFFARDETKATFDRVGGRLKNIGAIATATGAALTAVGGGILGGFGAALNSFADFGGAITDSMTRTGLGSDLLQSLAFSAEQAGGSIRDIEGAARTMNKTLAAAANGNKTAVKSLAALGMTAEELLAMSPDERFKALADGVAAIDDPALRSAAAMKVFGKSASNIMETLSGGAEEINRTTRELQEAGLILSAQDIANADELGDAWGLLTTTLTRAWQLIGAAVAPTVTELIGTLQSWVTWLTQVADANREWVVVLFKVAAGVFFFGTALTAIGATIFGIGAIVAAIPAIVAGVGAAIGFLASAFAFLISPIGLTIVGIAGLLALMPALAYVIDANFFNGSGLQMVIDLFGELWRVGQQTIGGIFDAIATGNWGLAAGIAMAGLNVVLTEGWENLKTGLVMFGAWILETLADIFGAELIGVVLKGLKAVIDFINGTAQQLGLGESYQIDATNLGKLSDAAANGDEAFKKELDSRVDARRKAAAEEVKIANDQLDNLTQFAADEKEKRFAAKEQAGGKRDPLALQSPADALQQTISMGATSSAAAGRLAFNQPVFDKIEQHLGAHGGLLERIADNTEDLEPEGLDD